MNSCTKEIIEKQLLTIKDKYNNDFYIIPENFIKNSINELKMGGQKFSDKYIENLYDNEVSKEISQYLSDYQIERKILLNLWKQNT